MVDKESISGVDIYDYKNDNYMTVMRYGAWRIAYLNNGDKFFEKNFQRIERHLQTDEAFILLEGEATLIIGEELNRIKMEPHKVYNVPKGVWHHIFTGEGTRVVIVENEDTGADNSEYMSVSR